MMSHARFQEMVRSVNSTARKVFDVVPIAEAWTLKDLRAELQRGGINISTDALVVSVGELKTAGVITERCGQFQRVECKPRPVDTQQEEPLTAAPPRDSHLPIQVKAAPAPAMSPLDAIAILAQRVKKLSDVATMMVNESKAVAEELEAVAIDIEVNHEQAIKGMQQLAQLRTLLKNIGGAE